MNYFNDNLATVGPTFDYIMRSIRKPVDDHKLLSLCSKAYIDEKRNGNFLTDQEKKELE